MHIRRREFIVTLWRLGLAVMLSDRSLHQVYSQTDSDCNRCWQTDQSAFIALLCRCGRGGWLFVVPHLVLGAAALARRGVRSALDASQILAAISIAVLFFGGGGLLGGLTYWALGSRKPAR